MTMLCLIGGMFTPENEKEVQQYDAPDAQIHLFDNVLPEISLGKVLAVAEQMQDVSEENRIFYTDIEGLSRYVNVFLNNVFTKVLIAGRIPDYKYTVPEYERLILAGGGLSATAVVG